jgi:hypothetical protein
VRPKRPWQLLRVTSKNKNMACPYARSGRKRSRTWDMRRLRYTLLGLLTVALALGLPHAGASEVSIGTAQVERDAAVVLPVMICNATNLGSIDLELVYNYAVLIVTNVSGGDFDVLISNLEASAAGHVRIVAFQTASPGITGTAVLARLALTAVGDAGSTSSLKIRVNKLTDATPQCRDLPYSVTNGTFSINPGTGPTSVPFSGYGGAYVLPTARPPPSKTPEPVSAKPASPVTPPPVVNPSPAPSAPPALPATARSLPARAFPELRWPVVLIAIIIAASAILAAFLGLRRAQ